MRMPNDQSDPAANSGVIERSQGNLSPVLYSIDARVVCPRHFSSPVVVGPASRPETSASRVLGQGSFLRSSVIFFEYELRHVRVFMLPLVSTHLFQVGALFAGSGRARIDPAPTGVSLQHGLLAKCSFLSNTSRRQNRVLLSDTLFHSSPMIPSFVATLCTVGRPLGNQFRY